MLYPLAGRVKARQGYIPLVAVIRLSSNMPNCGVWPLHACLPRESLCILRFTTRTKIVASNSSQQHFEWETVGTWLTPGININFNRAFFAAQYVPRGCADSRSLRTINAADERQLLIHAAFAVKSFCFVYNRNRGFRGCHAVKIQLSHIYGSIAYVVNDVNTLREFTHGIRVSVKKISEYTSALKIFFMFT